MKTLLNIYKFAFKSAWTYKANFIISSVAVMINDVFFFLLYIVYLHHFKSSWIIMSDFLLAWWIFTFWYAVLVGFLNSLTNLAEIIEDGKLDYYLSYPIHPLKLISLNKIDPGSIWDILFSIIAFWFYFYLTGFSWLILLKVLFVTILWGLFIIWLAILVWSISFFIQRASLWTNYIWYVYWTIGSYPYKVFMKNIIIITLSIIVLLYPSWILGQLIILKNTWWVYEIIFFLTCIITFIVWIFMFNKWLKKYTSWNLVNNNI